MTRLRSNAGRQVTAPSRIEKTPTGVIPIPNPDLDGCGILALLVLIAGVVLLVTGSYPKALFDVIVGLNRWMYRVLAYVALMTDRYPPFRLDQGGSEPPPEPRDQPTAGVPQPVGSAGGV